MEQDMRERVGKMITKLVIEHKKNCNDPECDISVYFVGKAVEELTGRKLAEEERKIFL